MHKHTHTHTRATGVRSGIVILWHNFTTTILASYLFDLHRIHWVLSSTINFSMYTCMQTLVERAILQYLSINWPNEKNDNKTRYTRIYVIIVNAYQLNRILINEKPLHGSPNFTTTMISRVNFMQFARIEMAFNNANELTISLHWRPKNKYRTISFGNLSIFFCINP